VEHVSKSVLSFLGAGMPFGKFLQLDMAIWHTEECKVDYGVAIYWYSLGKTTSNIVPPGGMREVDVSDEES
jgi:hypothetical protein